MLNRVIDWSIRNQFLVLIFVVAIIGVDLTRSGTYRSTPCPM